MKLLPYEIAMHTDPETGNHILDLVVADDIVVFSERTWTDQDGPTLHHLALVHVIAVTRRVASTHEEPQDTELLRGAQR